MFDHSKDSFTKALGISDIRLQDLVLELEAIIEEEDYKLYSRVIEKILEVTTDQLEVVALYHYVREWEKDITDKDKKECENATVLIKLNEGKLPADLQDLIIKIENIKRNLKTNPKNN